MSPAFAIDWDGKWFVSHTGGSTVELPSFLVPQRDFMEHGVSLGTEYQSIGDDHFYVQQFVRPEEDARPYDFINTRYGAPISVITYQVDQDHLGVVSGYRDRARQQPFYDICRRTADAQTCLSIGWEPSDQRLVERLVDHIFQTFVPDPQWKLLITP